MVIFVALILVYAATWVFLHRTWLGRSFRVVAINPLGAQVCGVNLRHIRLLAFAGGGLIAGLVGWLYAPLSAAGYLMGEQIGLKGFICLIIGGMTTLFGPLAGGLLLGMLEVFADFYIGSIYSQAIAFVLLLLFLTIRPNGLLGRA
jgi:branched-chain amino acid transport system permease protein